MIEVKPGSQTATANLKVIPQAQVSVPTEPVRRSRHAPISNDLYTYQGYKTWMHNLRLTRDTK
jgi:hypothetical protein